MLGAIAGDIIGSVHEFRAPKSTEFPLFTPQSTFTDDTILTIAVAEWILDGRDLVRRFHEMVARYPAAGWGLMFARWARAGERRPYGSFGNGAAMRVSAAAWAAGTLEAVLETARRSAVVTHDHPEGIKGAQATAAAVFLARTAHDKELIRREITRRFGYDLGRTVDTIRPSYGFDETCQRTVPEAIVAFLDSTDFEDAVRLAISLGGDADTLACITGAIAHAHYGGVPPHIAEPVLGLLDPPLRAGWEAFRDRYDVP